MITSVYNPSHCWNVLFLEGVLVSSLEDALESGPKVFIRSSIHLLFQAIPHFPDMQFEERFSRSFLRTELLATMTAARTGIICLWQDS